MRQLIASSCLLAVLFGSALLAQNAPQTKPVERAKYTFTMPPGFEKTTIAGHTAVYEPAQAEWIKKALTEMKPASRPTTMPSDLIQRATSSRGTILKGLKDDLLIADEKSLAEFYDTKFLPTLKKYDELKPPVYYLVTTREKLRDLTKEGWGKPRFFYNDASNLAVWDETLMLSIDHPVEEAVVVFYLEPKEKETDQDRANRFTAAIREMDTKIQTLVADRAQLDSFNMISQHIGRTYLEPLKLPRDQMWLALGSAAVLTSKYTAMITLHSRERMIKDITNEDRRYAVNSATIDLTKPMDEASIRKIMLPAYTQAMRRKATAALSVLVDKHGDEVIGKILNEVKTNPPKDGKALVKMITDRTGVDLTAELTVKDQK